MKPDFIDWFSMGICLALYASIIWLAAGVGWLCFTLGFKFLIGC